MRRQRVSAHLAQQPRFTPFDPAEDTEREVVQHLIRPGERFTPFDPAEDTESTALAYGFTTDQARFTPFDPAEDTESSV